MVAATPRLPDNTGSVQAQLVVDTRNTGLFRASHLTGAMNIPDGGKFETWLGSLVAPELDTFRADAAKYTVIDVRTEKEVKEHVYFKHAIHIPVTVLEERLAEIPTDKPIMILCTSGYRSAIGGKPAVGQAQRNSGI